MWPKRVSCRVMLQLSNSASHKQREGGRVSRRGSEGRVGTIWSHGANARNRKAKRNRHVSERSEVEDDRRQRSGGNTKPAGSKRPSSGPPPACWLARGGEDLPRLALTRIRENRSERESPKEVVRAPRSRAQML